MGISFRRLVAASAALGLTASPLFAATVKGVLKGGGFVVNALTASGGARSATPDAKGKWSFAFPGGTGKGATLQLVRADGTYFGTIVLKRKGTRDYVALSGKAASLKTVKVLDGFAVVQAPGSAIAKSGWVTDVKGKPAGAGKLGLVAATGGLRRARAAGGGDGQPGAANPAADTDGDGIPDAYDADDDGDLVLDGADDDTPRGASIYTSLFLGFAEALNANAAGVTQAEIDANFAGENRFGINFWFYRFEGAAFGGQAPVAAHVDCFGLPYCRRGDGTAILTGQSETPASVPLGGPWTSYSPDGSGYPNLYEIVRANDPGHPVWAAGVQPRVPTSEIHPGDAFNVTFETASGTEVTVPAALSAYFVTVPAIQSYDPGAGPVTLAYPLSSSTPGANESTPIQLAGNTLRLVFWRPQRPAIVGAETGTFTDMGHLHYGLVVQSTSSHFGCPSDTSALSSTLGLGWTSTVDQLAPELFPLTDEGEDAAPDPSRTLAFTVDLVSCLARNGAPTAGQNVRVTLTATGEPVQGGIDNANLMFNVRTPD